VKKKKKKKGPRKDEKVTKKNFSQENPHPFRPYRELSLATLQLQLNAGLNFWKEK
jgi:hypothetical protein